MTANPIDDYLDGLPEAQEMALGNLRTMILKVVPTL